MARTTSSTTILLGNATWSSGTMMPGLADRITGSVFADQAGTIYIEQSGDGGTNWDVSTSYALSAGASSGFSEEILLPYVRVRYVNGATNQGAFRIFARMSAAGP